MRWGAILAMVVCAGVLAGCAHTMTLPATFVPVGSEDLGDYCVRGISADGVVVALKTQTNPKEGTLDFWVNAATNQLTGGAGYKLDKSEGLASETGTPGKLLTFSTQLEGAPFTYLLAIFVQGGTILVGEAGGKTDAVTPKLEEIRKAFATAK